mmetsp:Transcript_452/g.1174  ORF Transcript_452/g.1174 Transcript_452/m.1174 type:complete len:347 (+) Transcript_452:1254-2294(+)
MEEGGGRGGFPRRTRGGPEAALRVSAGVLGSGGLQQRAAWPPQRPRRQVHRARPWRRPHQEPGRAAHRQEHARAGPPVDPHQGCRGRGPGRGEPPARGAREAGPISRIHRLHAVGDRQHQDLRREPRAGAGAGRYQAGARQPGSREQGGAHPARRAGPPSHRRGVQLLGCLPRPLRQPDEFAGPRYQDGGRSRRAYRAELRAQARVRAGRGDGHFAAPGRHPRLLQRGWLLLCERGHCCGERRQHRRGAAAGAVPDKERVRPELRRPWRADGVHGPLQVRIEQGRRDVPESGQQRDLPYGCIPLLRQRPHKGRRELAQGWQEARGLHRRHHYGERAGALAVGPGQA